MEAAQQDVEQWRQVSTALGDAIGRLIDEANRRGMKDSLGLKCLDEAIRLSASTTKLMAAAHEAGVLP